MNRTGFLHEGHTGLRGPPVVLFVPGPVEARATAAPRPGFRIRVFSSVTSLRFGSTTRNINRNAASAAAPMPPKTMTPSAPIISKSSSSEDFSMVIVTVLSPSGATLTGVSFPANVISSASR